ETEGLWFSSNFRSASPTFTQVANYPFRQPERVFFNPNNINEVWVTSFGGGVFVGMTDPLAPTTAIPNAGAVQRSRLTSMTLQFPQPVNAATLGTITLTRTAGGPATVVQTGATGPNGRITVSPSTGLVSSVVLTFDVANGAASGGGVEYGSLADGRWQV